MIHNGLILTPSKKNSTLIATLMPILQDYGGKTINRIHIPSGAGQVMSSVLPTALFYERVNYKQK
jgi:hypothetical protein